MEGKGQGLDKARLLHPAPASKLFVVASPVLSPFCPLQLVEDVAEDILLQIPEPLHLHEVINKFPVLYEESMNTVLVQEVIR